MWRTSHGDRVLGGDEASAFMESVGYLRDMITTAVDTGESYQTGVTLFDSLQSTQQLVALHQVATALIRPEIVPPELSAILEATIYAVYRELYSLVEIEIDVSRIDEFTDMIRHKVLDAYRTPIVTEGNWASEDLEALHLPESDCVDPELWADVIEGLADRVLWDRDFELEELLADKDPIETAAIKEYLGISKDYFAIAAPDAVSDEFQRLDRELVALRNEQPFSI